MKKTIIMLFAASALTMAMTPADKFVKIFYKDTRLETKDAIIEIKDAVSTEKETKFKLKITNKTSDYLVFKPNESVFTIDGKEFKPTEKNLFIDPNESESRVINIKGSFNNVRNYSYLVEGLYRASAEGTVIKAADFKLPAAANEFKAGGFKCSLLKVNKETDATKVKFNLSYDGDKIGIFNPKRVSVLMPTGAEYANADRKADAIILLKGMDDNFTLEWTRMPGGSKEDMQKVDMMINWKDAFTETTLQKSEAKKASLDIDEALTNEKGK